MKALAGEKLNTIQLMIEAEKMNVDSLRQELAGTNSPKIEKKLEHSMKILAKLEEQLECLKAGKV